MRILVAMVALTCYGRIWYAHSVNSNTSYVNTNFVQESHLPTICDGRVERTMCDGRVGRTIVDGSCN